MQIFSSTSCCVVWDGYPASFTRGTSSAKPKDIQDLWGGLMDGGIDMIYKGRNMKRKKCGFVWRGVGLNAVSQRWCLRCNGRLFAHTCIASVLLCPLQYLGGFMFYIWTGLIGCIDDPPPPSRCCIRYISSLPNLNPEKPSNMSHETVYYSRPRTYGKGSRNWYVVPLPYACFLFPHSCT